MLLRVGCAWAQVEAAGAADLAFLRQYLSFETPQATRARAVMEAKHAAAVRAATAKGEEAPRAPAWDGRYKLFDERHMRLPSGLVPSVIREAARRGGLAVDVADARVAEAPVDADTSWLRGDYQPAAVAACLLRRNGVVKMGTGGGKTEVFVAVMARVPCRWVVLVEQTDLLDQTAERLLKRTGEQAGVVGDGRWEVRRVTICMVQTLLERAKTRECAALLRGAGGMIFDECHGLGSPSRYRVAMRCVNAGYRLGFSGTPFRRSDKRDAYVMAATGPKIYDLPAADLAAAGYLTPMEVVMVPLRQRLPPGLSWRQFYGEAIAGSDARNALLVAVARRAQKPALLFVKELAHGRDLEKRLLRAGVPCSFVWGGWGTPQRAAAIRALVRGDAQVLVTNLFEQGTDIPEVRDVIVGAGGKSAIKAVQRPGRAMRLAAGKEVCRLWDVDDSGQVWLDRHAAARFAEYVREGHRIVRWSAEQVRLMQMGAERAMGGA